MTVARTFIGHVKHGVVTVELDRPAATVGRLSDPPKLPPKPAP